MCSAGCMMRVALEVGSDCQKPALILASLEWLTWANLWLDVKASYVNWRGWQCKHRHGLRREQTKWPYWNGKPTRALACELKKYLRSNHAAAALLGCHGTGSYGFSCFYDKPGP